ncbi:sulfurtransferase [Corticibacter populi]|uniref:Sulfurtransferase n=1 Tax=Corticibacter populi TaxID=1550736 RepID=A0A3M6R0J0_9BURK|nr:rhodanese-like domain-containing protein [Corticibacter populi]RMX08725.1 sulfurtransferase [Corticibacter populi]RZS36075.1 rhodanese-related sulfurtransferase [Corticibacter populi]
MIEQIDPQNFRQWIQQQQADGQSPLLIDVREPWEWAVVSLPEQTGCELQRLSMGQIPGELNLLDPDRPTALLCHHGVRSQNVANFLHANGFTVLANIRGGIDAWASQVDPSLPHY